MDKVGVSVICDGVTEVENCGVLNLVPFYLVSDDAACKMIPFFTIFCFQKNVCIEHV
jgi:hypothetical protein